ncbi:MAG: EMC3/TMCO1 family protein [Candidatus Micrarchaeota archaeon]
MITTGNFFWIVTLLGIVYSLSIRFIQMRFTDQERMKSLQKQMNDLNKEYFSAMKSGNKKRMDSIQEEQNKLMPQFSGMMMGQLKLMAAIISIFLAFMAVVNALDPFLQDDKVFELFPSGTQQTASSRFCGSFPVSCSSSGPWLVEVTAYSGGSEKGANSTYIYCGSEGGIRPSPVTRGTPFPITTDKKVYAQNDTATVCISAPVGTDRAEGKTNSGTWFMVPLPFAIPVLNVDVINGANIWFILVSIISGLVFSFAWGKIKKKDEKVKS